jgi:small subunit ribosomal protein S16
MIGHYNPRTEPPTMVVDLERARYWLGVGAQPTDAVRRILEKLMAEEAAGGAIAETPAAEAETVAEATVEAAEEEASEELSAISSEPEPEAAEAEPEGEAAPEAETTEEPAE